MQIYIIIYKFKVNFNLSIYVENKKKKFYLISFLI